jgi:ketosteroid isomerase-like protein
MKRWIVGCTIFLTVAAACSSGSVTLSDADRTAIAAAVDSATRAFQAAERARDAERTIAHLAPDFSMYNDGVRSSYDAVVRSIRATMGTFQHFEPQWSDLVVRVLAPNAAVVSFTFRDSIVTESGDLLRFTGPTTLVWEQHGTDWLIVFPDADHYPVE